MKTTVDICTCQCGKNTVILDENFQGVRDLNDIECPVCGGEIVEFTTRDIDINKITVSNKKENIVQSMELNYKSIADIIIAVTGPTESLDYKFSSIEDLLVYLTEKGTGSIIVNK